MEPTEQTKTTSDAESFAEYKAIRRGEPVAAAEPPKTEDKPSEPPSKEEGETGETTDTSKPSQEKKEEKPEPEKPKRDRTAEGRISELTARNKRYEQELADLRRKLDESTRAAKPAAPGEATPPPAKPAKEDPEPKPDDFDSYEKYVRAAARWEARQERKAEIEQERKQAEERQRLQVRNTVAQRLDKARAKYEDFDAVTDGDVTAGTGLVLTPAMQQFVVEDEQGFDAVYYLGQNPEEAARIQQLSPARQIVELGKIADRLNGSATPTPEKQKPPVSKAPPPPKVVGGTEPPTAKSTAEALSYSEHKRLRMQGRA